jgi:hypothetical protein
MNRLVCLLFSLLVSVVMGCGDPCEVLVEEACQKHGGDSVTCLSRSRELEDSSKQREEICARAVILYRSLPVSE